MPNRPWKKREVKLLKTLFAENKELIVKGRTPKSIRKKLISLGLVEPAFKITNRSSKKKWTIQELESLKKGKALPNRSKDSIRGMSVRLGLIAHKKGSRSRWTKEQEEILLSLVKEGKTAKAIFELKLFPYSKNSIQKKMCYLGLAKKRKTPVKKLSEEEKFILRKFLLENYKGKTPDDLVSIWNEKPYFKVNRSKVLYHLNDLNIKVPYYEVAKINNLRKKESVIRNTIHKSQKELEESIRLARIDFMRQRFSSGKDIWTGVETEETRDFATPN
jgi:hypothetical protein